MDQGQLEFAAAGVDDIDGVIRDARLEVAVVFVEHLDPLLIFVELGRVVGVKRIYFRRRSDLGMPIGRRFFIARRTIRALKTSLPLKVMVAHFHLGPFVRP